MSDLREAAQQALAVINDTTCGIRVCAVYRKEVRDVIAALRAALEQDEPVEPVAWMYTGIKQDGTEHGPHLVWKPEYMDAMSASKGSQATPLYTAPPQRKPLTDDRLWELWNIDSDEAYKNCPTYFQEFRYVARIVEWAHGIEEVAE